VTKLRQVLVKRYKDHYARINESILLTSRHLHEYEKQFGHLLAKIAPNSKILDLACGTGLLLGWLAHFSEISTIGVDASPSQISVAREQLPSCVSLYCEDATTFLSARPNTFAGIFCTDFLEHVADEDDLLDIVEKAREALVEGGFFVCRVPNMANLLGAYSRYMDLTHARGFTSTSLLQLLEAAGLTNCEIVPRKPTTFRQRARMSSEYWLHRVLFRVCGRGLEKHFATNLMAIAYK
jgi:2-polyprenyl-3-methyl-5-hydroxy-6-metoxy-1,4-benzoquinol methylase